MATAAENTIDGVLSVVLIFGSTLFVCVGCYSLADNHIVIKDAEISDNLKTSAKADREYPDIEELQKTNEDIVAWLTLDDTPVDYPITQSINNEKYINKDYKGDYSAAGNPFLDYRNDLLNDDYVVIYGHRMARKKMFGSLAEYSDSSYLEGHQTGAITTENGTFELEVISYSVKELGKTKIYNLLENRNGKNREIIEATTDADSVVNDNYSKEQLQSSEVDNWRLLLLSTCDKDSRHHRDVLLLRIGEAI